MESLKSQSEQCIFILTAKFENSAQLQCLPDSIRNYLFEKKSFPILLSNEVRSVPKKANSECTLNKIIHKILFPIEYNKNFLEDEILSKPTLIQKARDYISLLILHFYLSFFQTYEHDIDDIVTILKSLLLIILNKVNKNEKYQNFAISGFITIILEKQFQIDYSNPKFLSCISDFFSLPIIPHELLQVLQFMVEKIGKNTNNDDELSNVLQIVNYSFQKYRPLFSSQFIKTIFDNLKSKFLSLNYIVLSFFSQLSEILNDQDAEVYIKAFPTALVHYYDQSIQEEDNKLPKTKINFDESYSSENPESIKVTLPLLFKENPPLLNLNKLELKSIKCQIFNLLMNIIKSKHKKFANIFIEQVIQTLQLQNFVKYYELLAIYIHFLIQLSPISTEYLENTRFLFEEPYFQIPSLCKDSTSNELTYYLNPYVSSIRFLIMNFLFRQEFIFIQSVFQSVLKRDSIFPEFCYRCLYVDEKFRHPELGSLLFEIYSKQISYISEEGRIACLITMKNLNCVDVLLHAFNIICDDCTNNMIEKSLSFIIDIIKYSTHVMQMNNLLIESFESIFDKICFLLTKLPQNNPLSKLIFTHSISLFSVRRITQDESNAIETSAISLFGPTTDLKQLIISLMGADNGIQNEFIIKQPKAILLLVRLFKYDRTIWPFLINLCNYSPINSFYCHEAGVDSIVLEQLLQYKVANDLKHEESTEKDEDATKDMNHNNDKKIDDLLTLFYRISKFSSSISIVNRYMSLLCNDPISNRVSDYHMKFVKLINALAQETQKIPMTAFYEFQEFSNIEMADDWTISIWIFVTDRLNCSLFSISIESLSYEISIQNQNIKLNINKSQTDHQFDCEFPLYDWVCLTFIVDSQNTTLFVNGKKQSSVSHQSISLCTANFVFNASKKLLIGGITIYNTTIKENLYELGPRRIWKDPENTLSLAIRPHIHNNQLETVCFIYGSPRIKKEFKKAFSIMNFIDILSERCGVTLILPLMVQIKMQNADSELLIETLSIIKNLLYNRSNSQKKFREMNGIRILSHLLTCCYTSDSADKLYLDQTNLLNYKIYTKLFEIYSILEEEKSKQKFLKYILVNLMIWVHCNPEDVVKIMSFLASQNKETFWKYHKLNYSFIISAFRVYFSLNDYQNVPRFKGTEKEIDQIRQNLITFARNFVDEKIVNSDFRIIISYLKYSADMSKEIDLFRYLEEIINTDFRTSKNIKPESKLMISYLMRKCIKTIVDSSKPSINQSTINYKISCDFNLLVEVIKLFYNSNYQSFSDNENQHFTIEMTNNRGSINIYKKNMVYYLMRWISDSFIDSSFLKLLIPLINENYPLLFPLGAMISVSLDEENFNNFLQQIKLNPKVTEIDDIWYLWIIIGIYEFKLNRKEDEINQGIELLLNNSPINQLENIFLMLINLSLYKKYNETNVLSLFLRSLSKRIDNEEKCSNFIKLAMHQIYLKKYQTKLNKNQTNAVKNNITNDEENNDGKEFTEKMDDNKLNLQKFRSKSVLPNSQTDKQISKNLTKFTSKKTHHAIPLKHSNEFESNVNTIDPKKNKKISMKTIDDLTDIMKRNIADYKNIQELKQNEKYNWLDISLVNQIVNAFLSFPSQKSIDDVIIVEAYRLKYAAQEDKVINKNLIAVIEREELSKRYSISYFNKICKKVNIESPFKQKIVESHLLNEYRKKKIDLLNCMKDIYDIVSKPIENTKEIFKYYADDLVKSTHLMFTQTIHDYLASVGLIRTKSKNKWSHLCASMMQGSESPWHSSIKHEKTHFKRDFSSCFCFCPFKLKINKKYDQHLIASFKRNTGNQKTAEELYVKFIQKTKEKENHNTYFDLQGSELDEDESEVDEEKLKIETDISQYIFKQDCRIIKISKEIDACFMLSKDNIVIQTESKVKKYPLHSIELILLRDYLHQPTAIEIFINNGTTILLNFNEPNDLIATEIQYQVIQINKSMIEVQQCTSNEEYFQSKKITQMWCENKISNFEYLILLNIYSGRTFNNASQYPFLPWIVFDYESNKIDPSKFRDFEKPIGAINPKRLSKLIENYEEKKNEGYPPFLYSSGPTCPLAVYYWLVRVEPFTTFHIDMQSGSFDNSDRVFSSWQKTTELVTTMDDMYRELPPEAFFSHDFLVNYNEISLGIVPKTNSKNKNDDINSVENFDPSSQNVLLPPWASNPFEFIYKNRKILESEYVSEHLHSWIDLVWGYKQNGQEAEKAYNVFRPEMYHDIWSTEEGKDEIFWPAIENSLSQVGQIPVQLFTTPHPKKTVQSSSKMSIEISEIKLDEDDSKCSDSYDFVHISNSYSSSSFFNMTNLPPIQIHVDEIKNFAGAQISIKRSNLNEDQLSSNYFLLKNQIHISGLTEDGEAIDITIGYKLNEESNLTQKRKTHKNSKFLGKNIRSKTKDDYSSISIDKDNVTYDTDIIKNHLNLTSDIKKKKNSLLAQKFLMNFVFLDESKICYSDNVQNVLIFDDLNLHTETELLINQNKITALAFDGDLTVAAFDSDGFLSILQIFKSGNDPVIFLLESLYTTPSFYERINCCDISKNFHQVVCGSSDGFILIFSLSNQTFLRTIKLDDGKSPQFIKITKSWGFIFSVLTEISDAKKKTFLAVWTINGDFIKMKETDLEITKITTWRSKSGFDYYLFATVEHKIIAGEVFTLENFFESNADDEVIELGYDYDLENAIVLSKDGMISFLPCSAPPPKF